MGLLSLKPLTWLLAIAVAQFTFVSVSTSNPLGAIDEALLKDIIESYNLHEPSTCPSRTDTDAATTFNLTYPGSNPSSGWANDIGPSYEGSLFQAIMSHEDTTGDRSWSIRVGTGGNVYSHFTKDMYGETMPPQADATAPWVDNVLQTVSVNQDLNGKACDATGGNCAPYFIHQAGAYKKDTPSMDGDPFFSPSLAKHCAGNSCSFASWGTQAHVPTPFTSPIIYINRYTNCMEGVIEHTQIIHNFADPNASPIDVDQTYFNVGWGGVRSSKLPYALEPTSTNLNYADADAVDYMPLCPWDRSTDFNQPGGRSQIQNIASPIMGGYTSFVGDGLLVNKPEVPIEMSMPCRKPFGDCPNNIGTCMVPSCTDAQVGAGYTRLTLAVTQGGPNCVVHNVQNPYREYVALACNFLPDTSWGHTNAKMSHPDPCAPWKKGTRIGFYNTATKATLEVAYVRHWSYATNKRVYLSVFVGDDGASDQKAIDLVNNMFVHSGSDIPIEVRTIHEQDRERHLLPTCKVRHCNRRTERMCMRQCSDEEEAQQRRIKWTRMQLAVPPGGPLCELDMLPGNYMGYVALRCTLRTDSGFGQSHHAVTTPIGLYNTKTGKTLEIPFVKHWSWNRYYRDSFISTYIPDDAPAGDTNTNTITPARQYAIDMVNEIFANDGAEPIPIEMRKINVPQIQPWCKLSDCSPDTGEACMGPCTDQEIADKPTGALYPIRQALSVPQGGPDCRNDNNEPYQLPASSNNWVSLICNFTSYPGDGQTTQLEERPVGFYNGVTNRILTVWHLSWNPVDARTFFSVSMEDPSEAISVVNAMFANSGPDPLPVTIVGIDPSFATNGSHLLSKEIRSTLSAPLTVPADYDPAPLPAFTFVYGDGADYGSVGGYGRRRLGSVNAAVDKDLTVFTVNWMGGARLSGGETYHNRGFMFSSELESVETMATDLTAKTYIDKIGLTDWSPRDIDIYQDSTGTSIVALAESSPDMGTTCGVAAPVCTGKSTPQSGYSSFFYMTCGASTFFGSDPYHFAPTFGSSFPNHGDASNIVRSYVCKSETDIAVRPTWKLVGFFNNSCATSGATYDETLCDSLFE